MDMKWGKPTWMGRGGRQQVGSLQQSGGGRTAVAVVTITKGVLIMMMFTTVGADEHGLTQRITGSRLIEWECERDRTQMKPIFQTASDKVDAIDTLMQKADLLEIEVQEWQIVERDRAQQLKAKDDIKFVSKMGGL